MYNYRNIGSLGCFSVGLGTIAELILGFGGIRQEESLINKHLFDKERYI
ncbi:hypothetical protein QUB80_32345 [Chlorogloeopsis sp. ULAP01]|nr:hypothetical protein [Chlorogloeopsis sp. ULAP01]MDM9385346.1 hypothetical protein [Chlorogloeopsis sp. ULAP01]